MLRFKVSEKNYFVGLPPFDTKVQHIEYTVHESVTHFKLKSDGLFPLEDVYIANGLTLVDMNEDIANNVNIVTLISSSGKTVVLPSNRLKYLNEQIVPYFTYAMGIKLGSLPENMDFTILESEIVELITSRIGVITDPEIVMLSEKTWVSQETHDEQLALRAVNEAMLESKSDEIDRLQLELSKLKLKMNALITCKKQ